MLGVARHLHQVCLGEAVKGPHPNSLRGGVRLGLATLGSDPLQARQARTAHPRRGGQGLLSAEQSLTLQAAGPPLIKDLPICFLIPTAPTFLRQTPRLWEDVQGRGEPHTALGVCPRPVHAPPCSTASILTSLSSSAPRWREEGVRIADSVPKAYKECPTAHSGQQREGEYLGNTAKPAGSPAAMPAYLAGRVCAHAQRQGVAGKPSGPCSRGQPCLCQALCRTSECTRPCSPCSRPREADF